MVPRDARLEHGPGARRPGRAYVSDQGRYLVRLVLLRLRAPLRDRRRDGMSAGPSRCAGASVLRDVRRVLLHPRVEVLPAAAALGAIGPARLDALDLGWFAHHRQPHTPALRPVAVPLAILCRLLFLPAIDFFEQGVHHLLFEDVAHDLTVAEDDALAVARRDADVRLAGFAGPVHHAAEYANFH